MRGLITCAAIVPVLATMIATLEPSQRLKRAAEASAPSYQGALPQPPQQSVDAATLPKITRHIKVNRGDNLQQAIDQARPGDQIELEAGATYMGPYRLPEKTGEGWIVITSAGADSLLKPGVRVEPAHAAAMATLSAAAGTVITADSGAHHYRFVGVRVAPPAGIYLNTLVQLGDAETDADRLPHDIIFDRCYLHGDPAKGARRGIALNARRAAVINSYLAEFKEASADSQALAGWNGPGPFTITNNYLEAAGENVMFGGADPSIEGLVPSDIHITQNHFAKPLRWRKGDPSFEGTAWAIKNLFELKNARRVVIDGNLFEHNWPDAQNGFAVLLTVRNQDGEAPWSVVEDVSFSNNVVRRVAAGINILGSDDIHPSQQTKRIAIHGNLFLDVGGEWGSGRLFQLLDGARDVHISSNTAFQSGASVFGGDHAPHPGFVFEKNVVLHNEFGIGGSGAGIGRPALARYFPDAVVRRNQFIGGDAATYPTENFFPVSKVAAGFSASPNKKDDEIPIRRSVDNAPNDVGADLQALQGVVERASGVRISRMGRPLDDSRVYLAGIGASLFEDRPQEFIFWASLLLIVYTYAGYPVLILLRARLRPCSHFRAEVEPTVSIVVAAHNEGHCIEARIENLLALDYPAHRLQILVGSDGSTDDTVARASRFADAGVRVHGFRRWRGKATVINRLVMGSTGDIILFADARQQFDRDVIRKLVSHFADPTVGAVSGELVLTVDGTGTSIKRGAAFYWRYEKFIRRNESLATSTIGATGAIYAIRRSLYEPIPTDTILDDALIPLRIARKGYAVQFEPEARAFQAASSDARQECLRKKRTIAGMFQLFARERWLLDPRQNPLWFETVSHKGLRLALPLFHTGVFVASALLAEDPFFFAAFMAQIAFYVAAAGAHTLRHSRRPMVLAVPYAMCLMLWATIAGFARFMTDRQKVTWEQSAPIAPSSSPAR
jgi:cellulose synthase/poly-beta-1,6-N-acetylglucosamine synthase-like glycosyltransferase